MQTVVELKGVNGEMFTLAGVNAGDKGVYLGTGVTGLFDPPVKAMYEQPGNYPGARYLNHRVLRRDVVFAVMILNDKTGAGGWLSRDSEWRKAWAFDRDCTMYVTTAESGTRYLKLRLFESPDVSTETDPNGESLTVVKMIAVAGDPFWYEDDVVYTATTVTNTTFDPNALALPWPWPQASLPTENLSITVAPSDGRGGLNPTDQYIFPRWTVPGSTFAPALPYVPGLPWLGAPNSRAVTWTLPDYSFEDAAEATRRVQLPGLIGGLRTNEQQAYNLDGRVTGGNYRINFNGEQTADIAYNANLNTVTSRLVALASVIDQDVLVERGPVLDEQQLIEVSGGPTGGSFTLTFDGQTTGPLAFNIDWGGMWVALQQLTTIGALQVGIEAKVTNEVQTITLAGEPTGGSFTLTFDGQTTGDIPFGSWGVIVMGYLIGLSNIGLFDVVVTRDVFTPYSPWYATFTGQYSGIDLQPMVANGDNLTGGAGMDVIVKQKTKGSRPYRIMFWNNLGGKNLPQITANAAGLTGGVSPAVTVSTLVPGSYPYLVTFKNNLSGQSFPLLTITTTGLTGGYLGYRSWKNVEGYTAPAENCVIDSDPRVEQVSSASGSAIWSRMNGVRFRYPIPPWTESKTFAVTVTGCIAGEMVSLRLPRPWSRPWGLE